MADSDKYDKALLRLQQELVSMQQWVREEGKRVVIVVEGRDAAGKGGVIKRITEHLNPRWCRIAALPAPSDREKTEWYFQRYITHLPAGGEIVLFDRSWYNRAGVERVMGFCTDEEYHRFFRQCPAFERMLIDDGIILVKYWFSVSDEEQERRFKDRLNDPLKRWKLSDMDLEGRKRWVQYSKAKDEMFAHCDLPDSPWYEVEADDKKRARLNCIAHLLSMIPYEERKQPKPKLATAGAGGQLPATATRPVPLRSRLCGDSSKARREVDWLRQTAKARTSKSRARIEDAHELLEQLSDVKRRNQQKRTDLDFSASERETRKLVVAKNLAKSIGSRLLFHHLDFVLSPGTRMGLMGPNGSGKPPSSDSSPAKSQPIKAPSRQPTP